MEPNMKNIICISLLAVLLPSLSYAEDQHKHQEPVKTQAASTGVQALSADLRSLLSQEMQAIQYGMMSIIPAYASGNWSEIETTAGKIKSSYILTQHLSKAQVEELHSLLPAEFIEKDENFHYLAGMLEHAAKHKKPELVNFYFSEMNRSCVSCHSAFATHKFPALSVKPKNEHAH